MTQLEIEFPRGPSPNKKGRLFALDEDDFSGLDKETVDHLRNGEWRRSSGSMICGWCHYEYREHRTFPKLGLTLLCDRQLVHL